MGNGAFATRLQATAPILDSTTPAYFVLANRSGCQGQRGRAPEGGLVAAADQFTGAASTQHWAR